MQLSGEVTNKTTEQYLKQLDEFEPGQQVTVTLGIKVGA